MDTERTKLDVERRADMDAFIRSQMASRAVPRSVSRSIKREAKHAQYHRNGLNGPRAVARRARQRMAQMNRRLDALLMVSA